MTSAVDTVRHDSHIHYDGTTSISNVHISTCTGDAIYAHYFLAQVVLQETKEVGDFPWWDAEMPIVLILCLDNIQMMQLGCLEVHEGHYFVVFSVF
jgi:hypothetical protein